jgi:hypothetical protein
MEGHPGEWRLTMNEKGEEIRSQTAGEGSGNLLLAIYLAAAHSEVVNHIL